MARLIAVAATLATFGGGGCTDWQLDRAIPPDETDAFDNKLALSGEICTSNPDEVEFPLKVLFVVDISSSMNRSDPVDASKLDTTMATHRSRAVRRTIERFIDLGVRFAPSYCRTDDDGCGPGESDCVACGPPGSAICVGPDCCGTPPCLDTRPCPTAGRTNGSCLPLCQATTPGCGPGERGCPICPSAGDRCVNGICAKALEPGVEFAIMRFGAGKETLTHDPNGDPGFTSDPAELVSALPRLSVQGGAVTDFEGALAEAYNVLSADMARMRRTRAGAMSRAKYVVVFLTDGQPDPRINEEDDWDQFDDDLRAAILGPGLDPSAINEYNVPSRILRQVVEITRLKALHRIAEITLHTAYLAGDKPSQHQEDAVNLLTQMARAGGGTFRNFQNGEAINFLHVDFASLRRVFRLKTLLVSNINARPLAGQTITDSDGDALDDAQERLAGTSATRPDSDGDGFSDTVEHFFRTSGWDPLDQRDADCPLAAYDADGDGNPDDRDGDGLLDCEERFLGTSADLLDSDADGLPDSIEVRFGTNPVADDTGSDLDFDGMPNGDEIRLHTDPAGDDAATRSRTSYRYDLAHLHTGLQAPGVACYRFAVENIALVMPRAATSATEEGWNTIWLYFGEVPFDNPQDFGSYRAACVRARYHDRTAPEQLRGLKLPPEGRLTLPPSAWKRPELLDPSRDCLCPDGRFGDCTAP